LACPRIGQVEPVLVDQHGLVANPRLPGVLRDVLVELLAELAGIGREVEAFGLALQLHAENGAGHSLPQRFLISTRERRCQLYMFCRSSGSWSTEARTKPRLRNQCMVRVVRTNRRLRPAARARCSIRLSMRSPSPRLCDFGLTARQ